MNIGINNERTLLRFVKNKIAQARTCCQIKLHLWFLFRLIKGKTSLSHLAHVIECSTFK